MHNPFHSEALTQPTEPLPLAPKPSPRRSLLRLRGKIIYWNQVNGKPGTWGVLRSKGRFKFHVHQSEIRNCNHAPVVGQRAEFTPRPPRARGELMRAVDVFIEKKSFMD